MFGYGKCGRFTWTGTLEDCGRRPGSGERVRPTMATTGASGLEVLLTTLQGVGDTESALNILNVLDELLSAGTDRRIHYMISKGGSEALLSALVKTGRCLSPNYAILLPLLHLLAKVGHRDRWIGLKAEKADAVLLTLGLLRQNSEHPQRAAACLWVLRVFCSSVSTATLLGENRGLDVVFKLVSAHTTSSARTVNPTPVSVSLVSMLHFSHAVVARGAASTSVNVGHTPHGVGDTESALNILNVLDELLSAGTDRRIHYMISKGGSEALLSALVKTGRCLSPNYAILLPLLHLLAKVGHRGEILQDGVCQQNEVDRAQGGEGGCRAAHTGSAQAESNTPQRAAACLWVLRVFCSSVSTATLLGENRGLDVVFKLVSAHTTKRARTVKAAIDAFAALLHSKANSRCAVAKGYVSSLLKLYEDWHSRDGANAHVPIRRALLHCLHHATNVRAGRDALQAHGGMGLLFQSTQTCLANKATEALAELPAPGLDTDPGTQDDGLEEDSDDDAQNGDSDSLEYDDDLETDPDKLRERPKPDRPPEELSQYLQLCELLHAAAP
ncbi:hypothetical protein ANANG_G00208390 [Anguilla anguilla]|uniref:Uncharacterized protein n=1 Tax=Anguilla anguilla TaxID=7936 RepID=A0A9D3M317_ANGAN|nr:hypothetical protein ANANG_G00208390 [Anguilla anguilla]